MCVNSIIERRFLWISDYPILKRLEKGGYLTTYSVEHQGRLRKMYRISKLGIERIKEYLEDFKELMKVYQYIERETVK